MECWLLMIMFLINRMFRSCTFSLVTLQVLAEPLRYLKIHRALSQELSISYYQMFYEVKTIRHGHSKRRFFPNSCRNVP